MNRHPRVSSFFAARPIVPRRSLLQIWAARLAALAPLLAWFALAGCASSPPQAVPAAVQEARRLSEQAMRLQSEGQWPAAAQWWARAARQYQLLNQSLPLATAWHNQGLCLAENGQPAEARLLLRRALAVHQQSSRPEDAWRQEIALLQWADPAELPAQLEALTARRARGSRPTDPHVAAVLDFELARAHWRLGDASPAEGLLVGLEDRFITLGDPAGAATTAVLHARVLEALGRVQDAVASWRTALSRFEALAQPRGIAVALAGLGRVLAQDPATQDESRALLERAEANHRALGLPWPGAAQ